MPEVLWETTPVARKHHECTFCGRAINPGETYRRTRSISIDSDAPYTLKTCAHCDAFIKLYVGEFSDPDFVMEGYTEEDVEAWEPSTPEAVEHKRRWSIGWRHGRDLYPIPEAVASA